MTKKQNSPKKLGITPTVLAYSFGIAAVFPVAFVFYQYLDSFALFKPYSWIFFAVLFFGIAILNIRLFLFWDKGTHLIQFDEEKQLLDLTNNVHGDIAEFYFYLDDFLKNYYGDTARHEVYVAVFENDANVGLANIDFNVNEEGMHYYTVPNYTELMLPKNDLTANFFNTNRRPALAQDIDSLRSVGISMPGTLVFPLLSNDNTILGIWALDIEDEYATTDSPMMVISFARFILEGLLYNYYLQNNYYNGQNQQSVSSVINFNQTVNIINVILHEINTPMVIIRNSIDMLKKGVHLDATMINELELTLKRVTNRVSKMTRYVNLINSTVEQTTSSMKIEDVIIWLRNEYKNNKLNELVKRQGKTMTITFDNLYVRQKTVVCNQIVLSGLYELLENSVIHSPKQHDIMLKIGYTKNGDGGNGTVIFSFLNYGTIKKQVLENYKYVSTSDNFMEHSSAQAGIGIGLPLAFTSITKVGGCLEIQNVSNNQSVFVQATLPEK